MFDYEERKYQLDILVCSDCIYRSTCKVIRNSYCWKIIGLISQEKAMIEQAKKEGVKEFAEEVMKTTYINAYLPITEYRKIKSDIDKLRIRYDHNNTYSLSSSNNIHPAQERNRRNYNV
jgi:hypothetical protein